MGKMGELKSYNFWLNTLVGKVKDFSYKEYLFTFINLLKEKIKLYIKTASGAIASFPDGADDVLIISLVANVEPAQDLHGYDSPWPAGGGKNLLNPAMLLDQAGWNRITLQLKPNTAYTASTNRSDTNSLPLYFFSENGNPGSSTSVSPTHPVTQVASETGIVIIQQRRSSGDDSFANYNWQIEEGSAATAWAPYENECPISGWTAAEVNVNGETITHEFKDAQGNARTVYGGEDDLVGGKLRVTMGEIDSYAGENIGEPWISSLDAYTPGGTPTIGAQVVYMLAVPREYNLPPVEVRTLYGANTIFADCGDVSVTYYGTTPP